MRRVICALVLLTLPSVAFAGDFDVLRGAQPVGPASFTNWSGVYAGGQFGYSDAKTQFSGATQPLLAFSLRELVLEQDDAPSRWQVLGNPSTSSIGGGGFVGYNTQWQDFVLGVEVNYTHSSFTAISAETPISRRVAAGSLTYDVTVGGSGTLQMKDYASLRARGGWIFGNFMPYGFAGFAIGVANYNITSLVFGQESPATPPVVPCNNVVTPACVDFNYSNSSAKNSAIAYGFSVGTGLDVALTHNVFLRGEYEYTQFAPINGILLSFNTVRLGGALKF